MKHILALTLTLVVLLAFTAPSSASEETAVAPETGQEESVVAPSLEELPILDEVPPADSAPGEALDEPSEDVPVPDASIEDEIPSLPQSPTEDGPPGGTDGGDDSALPPLEEETPSTPEAGPPDDQDQLQPEGGSELLPPADQEFSEIPEIPSEEIIQVLVPPNGRMVVNPYHMPVAVSYGETTAQIVHEPQMLKSLTDFPVRVSVQVAAVMQPWSAAYFVPAPPADNVPDKQIFLYAEFQNDPTLWSGFYGDEANQLLITDWNTGKDGVLMLAPRGTGYFRLFGAMTPYPQEMWTSDDTPDVTLAFTFSLAQEMPPVDDLEYTDFPMQNQEDPEELPDDLSADMPVLDPAGQPVEVPDDFPDSSLYPDNMSILPDDNSADTSNKIPTFELGESENLP